MSADSADRARRFSSAVPHLCRRTLLIFICAACALFLLPNARAQNAPFPTGLVPSTAQDFARASRFVVRAKRDLRPARVLLTEFLPPPRSQGQQNSCVGWSCAYYAYTYAVSQKRDWSDRDRKSDKFQFSPAFVYHLGNDGSDSGMPIPAALRILKNQGCCTLAEMPYTDKDFSTPPGDEALQRAQKYIVLDFAAIMRGPSDATEKMKTFLADMHQPFVAGIKVYKTFFTADGKAVYNAPANATPASAMGSHAVTVIGYDDEKRAFRIINSWGEKWGDKGQLWMSEDFFAKNVMEAWGFVPGERTTRGLNPKPALPPSISVSPPRETAR